MIKKKKKQYKKASIFGRYFGNEFIIYNPSSKQTHILNKTSEKIWQLYDEKNSEENIAFALEKEFQEANYQNILMDVSKVINTFKQQGLLVISE